MRRRDLRRLGLLVLALLPALPMAARAQVGFSASLESDYLLRGVSLSDGRPILSLAAAYDHPSGAYGGLDLVGGDTAHAGVRPLGYTAWIGYAHRLADGLSWDVGASDTQNSVHLYRTWSSNYAEVYAGLSKDGVSAHIYYSPRYLGEHYGTVYLDVDDAVRLSPKWRLVGHAGALLPLGEDSGDHDDGPRLDFRAGVAHDIGPAEIHLAWTALTQRTSYPEGRRQPRNRLEAGLSLFF